MAEWQYFPLYLDRVADKASYAEADRKMLEQAVSVRTDRLLGLFGQVATQPIEITTIDEENGIGESLEYDFIKLCPFLLEDESQLEIGQLKFVVDRFETDAGTHFIEHTDEEGIVLRSFVVRHAKSNERPFVYHEGGKPVDIPMLSELYEALMALESDMQTNERVNYEPIDVATYPKPTLDVEFAMVMAGIEL